MSDSSDEYMNSVDAETKTPWVLYRDRPEWRDVIPVPQDDGPHPVVAIAYSEKFKDCYDYFRAILKSGEKSERALLLTKDCIQLNPANYTVWQYRREILKTLGKDLKEEIEYLNKITKVHPKVYQSWYHRKIIIQWLQDASGELEFTELIIEDDAKNYHAWQYRQWCISTFNLYDKELEYVEKLLKEDVRNNSAWNQRYFVINNTTKFEPEVIIREIDFALQKIELAKRNESAWNYLRGILMKDSEGLGYNEKVRQFCEDLYQDGNRSNHLLACIIDICQERRLEEEHPSSLFHINSAIQMCQDLAQKYDKIRERYWNYIEHILREKLKEES